MSFEELSNQYNQLVVKEHVISEKINEILENINKLKSQATELENKAQEEDLKISEKPAQVFEKACGSAFLGIGKSCQEIPVPNPEVEREISLRNDYIRQRNSIINKIQENLKTISELSKNQVDIRKEQVLLRSQIINLEEKILQEPINILNVLGRAIKSLFSKEQFQETIEQAKEAEKIEQKAFILWPYLLIGIVILMILLKKGKIKEEK